MVVSIYLGKYEEVPTQTNNYFTCMGSFRVGGARGSEVRP